MRRRKNEVNTRTGRARWFLFVASSIVVVTLTSSCGCAERHAERLWRQAIERVEKGDTQAAVDGLQRIIDEYPDTKVAARAREQIVVYRGLASAVESYPLRRARELMVQLARAIESFKREKGRAPSALDELVPEKIASVPQDPWGRPFLYETTARGYRLRCQDADGSPEGAAESARLLVVDGEFRSLQP